MSAEEFQIKTEVKLDTSKAEAELKNFTSKSDEKIPVSVDLKMKNIGKSLNSDLKNISKKLNQNLQINSDTIQGFQKLDNILKNVKSTLNSLENSLGNSKINIFNMDGLNPRLFDESIESIENYVKKVENATKRLNDTKGKLNNKKNDTQEIEPKIDTSKAEEQLSKFENKMETLRYKFNNLDIKIIGSDNISSINNQIDAIINKANTNLSKGLKINTSDIDLDVKNLREQLNLLKKIQTQYTNFDKIRLNLSPDIDTSSLREVDDAFEDVFRRITSMKGLDLDINIDGVLNSIKNLNSELKQTNTDFLGIKKVASDFRSEIASYSTGEVLGDVTVDFARSIGQSYMELDRSMREIKKVAQPSDIDTKSELNAIRQEAISVAKDVGMASSDVQSAIGASLQAGIGGMKESIEVAKQSMILANVGDMTQDSASKAINTVVKSFNLSPLKSYQLEVGNTVKKTTELKNAMDMMNFAGNNYAIGTDGIAEAMKRGGAVLSTYNVSLADSIGLITATNEALQDPARVGNGLKTIAINLAGMKTSAKDGTMSLNKTAMALKEIAGVDVYADKEKGELKNMVQILDEAQDKWGSLSDAQQKALSESIAGKQQATVFQSLMQNYKAFDKIRGEFASGEHFQSAEKENEQYVNSLDGKLNKLKETWIDTFTTLVNSDLAYGALDGLISISEAINKIVNALSKMNGGLTGGLFAGLSIFKNIPKEFGLEKDSSLSGLENIASILNELKSKLSETADSAEENADRIGDAVNSISETETNLNDIGNETTDITIENVDENSRQQGVESGINFTEGVSEGIERGSGDVESQSRRLGDSVSVGFNSVIERGREGLRGFSESLSSIGSSLISIGKDALLSFGAGMAIELGAKAIYGLYDSIAHKYENQKQAIQEKTEAIKQESQAHQSNLNWMQKNADRYDELIKKEQQYNKIDKSKWTDSQKAEMEELIGMKQQLAEMFPELVAGYDEMGNPIIAMTDSMQGLIDKTKEQIKLLQTEMVQQKIDAGDNAREEISSRKLKYGGQKLTNKLDDEFKAFASNADFYTDKVSTASTSWKNFAQNRKTYTEKMIQDQKALNKTLTEYNKLENEIQAGQLAKFQNQSNYEGLNNDAKGKISTLINSLDWGNLDDTQFSNWQSGIDNLINNFPELGDKANGIITKLNEVNSAFAQSKMSPEEYGKQINSLAREFSELTGMDFNTVKEGFDQMFAFDYKIQDKTEMLKAFGKELKDVQTDSLANSLNNQYESADRVQTVTNSL